MAITGITIVFVTCAVAVTSAVYSDTVCASEGQIACRNEACIPSDRECDGQVDCSDGSDETMERCKTHAHKRPLWPIIFHCNVAWTRDLYEGICPEVCKDIPELCTYAIKAEHGEPKTCKLPPYPDNGKYKVEDYGGTDTFSLFYSCDGDYDLDAPNYPRCERGKWINKPPNCRLVSGSSGVDEEDIRK